MTPPATPASATDTVNGTHLAAYALGPGKGFVLGVASPRRAPGDHTSPPSRPSCSPSSPASTRAARGGPLLRARTAAARRPARGRWPPCSAESGGWSCTRAPPGARPRTPLAASALGAALGSAAGRPGGRVVRVLVPAGRRRRPPCPAGPCGVSAPAEPPDWPAADTQAARALARARATRAAAGPARRPPRPHRPRPAAGRRRPTPRRCSPPRGDPRPDRHPAHLAVPARQLGPHGGGAVRAPQHRPAAHRALRGAAGGGPRRPGRTDGVVVRAAPRP